MKYTHRNTLNKISYTKDTLEDNYSLCKIFLLYQRIFYMVQKYAPLINFKCLQTFKDSNSYNNKKKD